MVLKAISYVSTYNRLFSPVLRFQDQQNFRNLEFRREILEFSQKSCHFEGRNLEFSMGLEGKFDCGLKPLEFRKFL